MMDNTVFDILIYVFDRYMLEELPASAERETLARDLESAGFGEANVERAPDWLAGWLIWRRSASARTCTATARFASMPQRNSCAWTPSAAGCLPRSRPAAFSRQVSGKL